MAAGSSTSAAPRNSSNLPEMGMMLESLLSSPFDPVLLLDAAGRIEAYNQAAETEIGALEQGWMAAESDLLKPILDVLEGADTQDSKHVWVSAHGRAFLLLANETPAGGTLISMRDVTDWRRLNQAQIDFMHVVSHDLRTPLTIAKAHAELLVEDYYGGLSQEQQMASAKVAVAIYGMVSLVDNLQTAARFDLKTGYYKLEATTVDLTDVMHKVFERHELPAELQQIRLTLTMDKTLPIIVADPVMLESAVGNLIDNAIKFSNPGGLVDVTVHSEGRTVLFTVRDQGSGIGEADHARIFERHVRVVAPGARRPRGSGLGLYIVHSVAQRHGGSVWVESKLGQGSTFFLRIPVRAANS